MGRGHYQAGTVGHVQAFPGWQTPDAGVASPREDGILGTQEAAEAIWPQVPTEILALAASKQIGPGERPMGQGEAHLLLPRPTGDANSKMPLTNLCSPGQGLGPLLSGKCVGVTLAGLAGCSGPQGSCLDAEVCVLGMLQGPCAPHSPKLEPVQSRSPAPRCSPHWARPL